MQVCYTQGMIKTKIRLSKNPATPNKLVNEVQMPKYKTIQFFLEDSIFKSNDEIENAFCIFLNKFYEEKYVVKQIFDVTTFPGHGVVKALVLFEKNEMTIKKYTIIYAKSMQELSNEVNKYIKEEGWQPIGGIYVYNKTWCQAGVTYQETV